MWEAHVGRPIAALQGEICRVDLLDALGLSGRKHFAGTYPQPGLDAGLVEMTRPDSPRSKNTA